MKTSTNVSKVIDEKSDPTGIGPRAYGSRLVYKLAQRPLKDGGGATRASTNADSYAWLVNSKPCRIYSTTRILTIQLQCFSSGISLAISQSRTNTKVCEVTPLARAMS